MTNRLAQTKSPYLQQHAENPVDWYPWGPEALEQANLQDKPLLVSIGYSACHWCHVMAHESFENRAIAELMNRSFINVKVDREERPDVDAVYMEAVQLMTGQGGWPLNVFLTPELKPFFGGTYWPAEARQGMPSWPQVLQSVALAWQNDRRRVEQSADRLLETVRQALDLTGSAQSSGTPEVLDEAFRTVRSQVDSVNGGFGTAPKFPQPPTLAFVLRTYKRTADSAALDILTLTLDRMAQGGIYDQVGGGFHRYSVDATWTVPHFEKMLYDNALLARVYLEGWQATGAPHWRRVVEETLDYVIRDLSSPEGGFYSAEDADSEGEEGRFYLWSAEEVASVLDADDAKIFSLRFGVRRAGNFEGRTILTVDQSFEQVAAAVGTPVDMVRESLDRSIRRFREVRELRVRPGLDHKVLTDWNALMLPPLCIAGVAFDRPDYLQAARRNARFLLERLRPNGRLLHVYARGEAAVPAFLDDHAFLIEGLLSVFAVTGEAEWLDAARTLAETLLGEFRDPRGGFFGTAREGELPVRPKPLFDNVIPSGNSTGALALLRLARVTDDETFRRSALETIALVLPALGRHPTSFGQMLAALEFSLAVPQEIVIAGDPDDIGMRSLMQVAYTHFLPNAIFAVALPHVAIDESLPLLAGRGLLDGRPAAYVCRNYACDLPVSEPADLDALLEH